MTGGLEKIFSRRSIFYNNRRRRRHRRYRLRGARPLRHHSCYRARSAHALRAAPMSGSRASSIHASPPGASKIRTRSTPIHYECSIISLLNAAKRSRNHFTAPFCIFNVHNRGRSTAVRCLSVSACRRPSPQVCACCRPAPVRQCSPHSGACQLRRGLDYSFSFARSAAPRAPAKRPLSIGWTSAFSSFESREARKRLWLRPPVRMT